ncbi:MAG: SUMF1/EgtB/PvdO family nonheme iron enzyme, partial [bacterium]|nr:SUMF1/EgtB/PvdO family nonheme iron enzyme [bacterium]
RVKLVDFGIAGLVEHAELSQKSRVLGTAAYAAPEALEPGGEVTPAADVYGAGAVAYELLTGKLPLGRFPQPSETRTDVPPELDRLVPELLDLDPAKRPPARRARQRAIARAIEPPALPVVRGKGRWAWVAVAGVLAVVVLFVIFGDFSDWRSPEPEPWKDPTTGMRFRLIPRGSFTMGSPESEPGRFGDETQHKVTLTRAFRMAATEVTQAQWRAVMGNDPSYFASCGDECPVEMVSWYDAVAFANRLSKSSNFETCYELSGCKGAPGSEGYSCAKVEFRGLDCGGYRLPTEAEWEYAARAGKGTALYTGPLSIRDTCDGPELDEIGWYCGNSGSSTHPVGRKGTNDWGLYDMLGNVLEWTWDRYAEYETTSARDPLGPPGGSSRVGRGRSWIGGARGCRAAYRLGYAPGFRYDGVGFRLVRTYP